MAIMQKNIYANEPIIIRSPATTDREDGFGWSAVFHQLEEIRAGDGTTDALRKIRYIPLSPTGCFCLEQLY